MAVGFILYYNNNGWKSISNPKFVFTSPNMDSPSDAGTRSHIVAGECEVGTWLEDETRNDMYKIACNQEESMTYPTDIHQYNYDDYRAPRVGVTEKATSPFTKVYLSSRPTTASGTWYPNPTFSGNSFEATDITIDPDNWWKLNESTATTYSDSIGSFGLVSSGGVVPHNHWSGIGYVAKFNGNSDSVIYSSTCFPLTDNFTVSVYLDSYSPTVSGINDFVSIVSSGTYFRLGCSYNNELRYSIKTDVSEYSSNTGFTLSSGTFINIVAAYDQNSGFYLYKDNSLLVHNVQVSGTVSSGNLCIGNTGFGYSSTFRGCISDVKYWDSYLDSSDAAEIFLAGQLEEYPICMFGSSVGDYSIDVSPTPVEMDKGLFYGFPTDKEDSHFSDTLHLWMQFGEAYNCYVTAWDDTTHSTTLNKTLFNELCKISACVYRSPDANHNDEPDDNQQNTSIVPVYDYVSDFPIKGNELFYGKFNLVYYVKEPYIIGDMLSIRPRISTINSNVFSPGNYDFILTFHYQYT